MIVSCPNCSTKFRLDDSKITEKGVKVRCSKCKHIFNVTKNDAIPDGDDTMIASPPEPSPPPTPAPSPEPEPKEDTFDFKEETPAPQSSSGADGFDDGLGDFSFDDEQSAAEESPPKEDFDDFDDFSFDDDSSKKEADAPPPPSPEPAPEPQQQDDDFGDFDFDDEPAPPPPPPPSLDPPVPESAAPPPTDSADAGFSDDFDFDDFSDTADSVSKETSDDMGTDDFAGDFGADDLGDGDFDMGLDSPPDTGASPPAPGGDDIQEFGDISFDDNQTPTPETQLDPGDMGGDELQLDTGAGGQSADEFKQSISAANGGGSSSDDAYAFDANGGGELPDTEVPEPTVRESAAESPESREAPVKKKQKKAAKSGKKGPLGKILAIVVILGVVGGAIYHLNSTGKLKINLNELNLTNIKIMIGLEKPVLPKDVIEIAPMKAGSFYKITRDDGKIIWILKGTITNYYETSQWMILLEASVKDGENIKTSQAMFGNTLLSDMLKKMPIEQLKAMTMANEDAELNQRILIPAQSAEFMIIFDNIETPNPSLVGENPVVIKGHEAL